MSTITTTKSFYDVTIDITTSLCYIHVVSKTFTTNNQEGALTMKNILIVNASKRRIGNSYTLEKRIAEQLEGKADVTVFRIGEKDVRACLACDGWSLTPATPC